MVVQEGGALPKPAQRFSNAAFLGWTGRLRRQHPGPRSMRFTKRAVLALEGSRGQENILTLHPRLVSRETFIGVPMLSSRATKLNGTLVLLLTSMAIRTFLESSLAKVPRSSDLSPASSNRCTIILRASLSPWSCISAPC